MTDAKSQNQKPGKEKRLILCVTATYSCYQGENKKFTQGNGAGGVHGASVSIYYNGDTSNITYADIRASHGMTDVVTDQVYSESTEDDWRS